MSFPHDGFYAVGDRESPVLRALDSVGRTWGYRFAQALSGVFRHDPVSSRLGVGGRRHRRRRRAQERTTSSKGLST